MRDPHEGGTSGGGQARLTLALPLLPLGRTQYISDVLSPNESQGGFWSQNVARSDLVITPWERHEQSDDDHSMERVARFLLWATRNAFRSPGAMARSGDNKPPPYFATEHGASMDASVKNAKAATSSPADVVKLDAIASLVPIERNRSRWPVVLAAALTALMTAGLAQELFGEGLGALMRRLPTNPLFYGTFGLLYLSPPIFDWLIFRKLWQIPAAGFAALLKKRIANEVLFGYAGEAYFYAWARGHMKMATAPFGSVKDISALLAIAGNAITLAILGIVTPFVLVPLVPGQVRTIVGSAAILFAVSLPVALSFKRIFALPKPTSWWVFGLHCLRITVGSALIALTWHFAMPDVSIEMLMLLAAARLVVLRLPLALNKDLLFAGAVALVIGQDQALSELVALTAALSLLAHIVVLAGLELTAMVRPRR